ncbi:MAG: TIGR03435 family protein [Candidatus Solibacter sp.]
MKLAIHGSLVALVCAWTGVGQTFDIASVKAAAPCCAAGQWRESKVGPDRIDFRYVTLKYCLAFAYRMKEFQVSGPQWLGETRFDIVAKGAEGTRPEQLPEMMQALLAERFKLALHQETKEFSVFILSVDKSGAKLKESGPEYANADGAAVGMSMGPNNIGKMEVKHGNMTSLVNTLSRLLARPTLDRTGLTARYDFDLDYGREDVGGLVPPATGAPAAGEPAASVFTSVKRLGLRLESQKVPMDTVVVDRGEKAPTEN